jgi:hypothetical protein
MYEMYSNIIFIESITVLYYSILVLLDLLVVIDTTVPKKNRNIDTSILVLVSYILYQ